MMKQFLSALCVCLLIGLTSCVKTTERIQIKDGSFIIDGKPTQLICGEMHYPRIPREYWRDRMHRAKAMGLNTVSAYCFWNFHERRPGEFDFTGQADVKEFIKAAQDEGLYVILRPGPYSCAEWDFGGYPSWLLKEDSITFRSRDPKFLKYCRRYINALGEQLAPMTINNGGNILMVQVENEYGSYGADKEYLAAIRDMIKDAGFNVPLFTCDGGGQIENGHVDGATPTLNGVFGEDIFTITDRYRKGGPYFVAEFYPAWFDQWGDRHSKVNYEQPNSQLDWMLGRGVSINMYMFHGGTNFEYTNGANTSAGYRPQPTSYDYDAPLGEWGNITEKYLAFRKTIEKYLPEGTVLPPVPENNPTTTFAEIQLQQSAPLSAAFHGTKHFKDVVSMEDLDEDFGYIDYQTTISQAGKRMLTIQDLRDYAVILVDGKQVGSLDRRFNQNALELDIKTVPAKLEILVENTGRVNYGSDILNNRKGITKQVLWGNDKLEEWDITPLPLYREKVENFAYGNDIKGVPAFHRGTFNVEKVGDTFIDMSQWGKGAVWVNGHSIGRYWNIGPQQTLYLPAPWIHEGENDIVVFEMEDTGNRLIKGLDAPILDSLGIDKNKPKVALRTVMNPPVLEDGDRLLQITLEKSDQWQEFKFPQVTTMRHFCLEITSSYTDDKQGCLSEIELLDEKGNSIDKHLWQIAYVSSEQTENQVGIAENLVDGDVSSFWHTNTDVKSKDYQNHCIIVDMKEICKVSAIRIKTRKGAFISGQTKDINVYGRAQFFLHQ